MPARVAVVGHVEWVEFIQVPEFPRRGGIIPGDGAFTHAGGGAVVAAAVLAELGHPVDFFCALGRDSDGAAAAAELGERGITVHAAWRPPPTRRVVTLLEPAGERTIITLGERIEPHGDDPLDWERIDAAQAVYFTAGDAGAAEQARRARALVATPRARAGLAASEVTIDALVYSGGDQDERGWAEDLAARARLMVETEGGDGGRWWGESEGRWPPVPLPGPPRDDYGCGDAFAAGLTAGLAEGEDLLRAAGVGARCGAEMLTRVGAP